MLCIFKGLERITNFMLKYLTALFHLRIVRSKDSKHFRVEDKPAIVSNVREECWGWKKTQHFLFIELSPVKYIFCICLLSEISKESYFIISSQKIECQYIFIVFR